MKDINIDVVKVLRTIYEELIDTRNTIEFLIKNNKLYNSIIADICSKAIIEIRSTITNLLGEKDYNFLRNEKKK